MRIVNPATEDVIADLPEDDRGSIAAKVTAARAAQPLWAARPLADRLAAVARFRERVRRDVDKLALVLTREMGKPLSQARNEINALVADNGRLDFFLKATEAALADEVVWQDDKMTEVVQREPLGLVANVSAWNYPYFVGCNAFIPALLAGNAVLYKPSEHATQTGLAIAELLHESGVPAGVFTAVIGGGRVGEWLLARAEDGREALGGVFFTGSLGTGRAIARAVGDRLVKLQLELGGKDPTYVMEDADPQAAAESLADGAMYNSGQSCCSVERVYVHRAIAEPFIAAFLATVKGFVVGDPEDSATYIGPLAREAQLAVLADHVGDARAKGATVAVGGARIDRKGYYFQPTVLLDVNHTMKVMRDESFGPIIGIQVVGSDDEAVGLMNDTEYGLTAGVYGRDEARARAVLAKVDAGTVYWNCCDRVSPRLPWTGRRGSGLGSTLGVDGIRAFTQPKAWHRKKA